MAFTSETWIADLDANRLAILEGVRDLTEPGDSDETIRGAFEQYLSVMCGEGFLVQVQAFTVEDGVFHVSVSVNEDAEGASLFLSRFDYTRAEIENS